MDTVPYQTTTADSTRLFVAYQSKRGVVPAPVAPEPAAYWALDAETADVGQTRTLERVRTTLTGREEGLPLDGVIDAAQSITVPLDKRVFGFHLGALLGPAESTDANANGFLQFEAMPVDGETVVINGVLWTFVVAAAGEGETEIGTTLAATLIALADDLSGSLDPDISEATYQANGHRLMVTAVVAGAAGDAVTLGAGTAAKFASAETLRGGGLRRHTFYSGRKDLPMIALASDQTDLEDGPRFKVVKDVRYGGMQISLQRSGVAMATFTAIGQREVVMPADPVAGYVVDAEIKRWSHLQGGLIVGGGCVCGVIESGQISYNNGLVTSRTMCCPGDPDSAGITDATRGDVTCTVGVNARYYDPLLAGRAESGKPVKIVHQLYDADDGSSLMFTFEQVTLPEATRQIRNGQSIVQNFSGIATKPAAGWSMVVELVNDVLEY